MNRLSQSCHGLIIALLQSVWAFAPFCDGVLGECKDEGAAMLCRSLLFFVVWARDGVGGAAAGWVDDAKVVFAADLGLFVLSPQACDSRRGPPRAT